MSLICDGNGAQLIAERPREPCEQAACHASFAVARQRAPSGVADRTSGTSLAASHHEATFLEAVHAPTPVKLVDLTSQSSCHGRGRDIASRRGEGRPGGEKPGLAPLCR